MDRDFVQGYVVEYGGFTSDPVDISAYRTINIADAVLPVTGLQFSASEAGAAVLLKWSTYTETSNSHFEIQRSADGRNFQKIGVYVVPDGNSLSTRKIAQKAHLVLSNSAGQRVSGTYLTLHKGTTTYSFNVVNLPADTYYLALYQTGGAMITEVKKIQIR